MAIFHHRRPRRRHDHQFRRIERVALTCNVRIEVRTPYRSRPAVSISDEQLSRASLKAHPCRQRRCCDQTRITGGARKCPTTNVALILRLTATCGCEEQTELQGSGPHLRVRDEEIRQDPRLFKTGPTGVSRLENGCDARRAPRADCSARSGQALRSRQVVKNLAVDDSVESSGSRPELAGKTRRSTCRRLVLCDQGESTGRGAESRSVRCTARQARPRLSSSEASIFRKLSVPKHPAILRHS